MKLTSSKTYKVIYYILENVRFTQLKTSRDVGVSFGQVNKVVQWLVRRNFAEKRKEGYYLKDPSGLVALFALERDMDSLLVRKIKTSLSQKTILEDLGKKHVLCLDSALSQYSKYYRSNRVCVYARSEKEVREIEKEVQGKNQGFVEVCVFKPDREPELERAGKLKATSKLRTLIDLVSDNKTFYAKDLFKQLWKVEFLES
ncbi:hypothetical protein HZB88_02390 [archaeon]|nr:hypothetical protein [archaeon]